ncbi:unnamed protein product, partial [Rotaria magnacalcarata]
MVTTSILFYSNCSDVLNTDILFHTHSIQQLSIVRVHSQSCDGISQYDRYSQNPVCACFHLPGVSNTDIYTDRYAVTCSELTSCNHSTNHCSQPDHKCVQHPKCRDIPVCYPMPNYNQQFCTPIPTTATTKIPTQQI